MRLEIIPEKGELPAAHFGSGVGFADCAVNTKFWHGGLMPFQCPTKHCEKEEQIITMFSIDGCDCISWDNPVDVSDCYCDYIVWTGEGRPRISTKEEICEGVSCLLGMPCPTKIPVLSTSGSDSKQGGVVYRYINKFGQASAPSPVSNIDNYSLSGKLSGIQIPSPDYCVSHVEIFISVAGNKNGIEKQIEHNSGMMSLGIYDLSSTISFSAIECGLEIDSLEFYPPPDDLKGITCHDVGLVGYHGKCIVFTEPNQIHAWSGEICLDHTVKAIKYWNQSLYVFTDSIVYRMALKLSDGGYTFGIPKRYGDRFFPLISDSRGVSSGQSGIVFPSINGLVLVNEAGCSYITSRFKKDDWLSINPRTMKTAIFDYGVGLFTDKASYVHEFGDGSFGELKGELYQLDFIADGIYMQKNGVLNYSIGGKWYKWDNCYETRSSCNKSKDLSLCKCDYFWRSKPIILNNFSRFTSGIIEFEAGTGQVELKIYSDRCDDKPILSRVFDTSSDNSCRKRICFRKYFRIRNCNVSSQLYIELRGVAHVRRVVLATSRQALKKRG